MKTIKPLYFLAIIMVLALAPGCVKQELDNTAEYTTQTDDQLLISAEIDAVASDATTVADTTAAFFQRTNTTISSICDAVFLVDSTDTHKYITINYNGLNCSGRSFREGKVTIKMLKSSRWSDANAVLSITYHQLQITRKADNKSIVLNGEVNITNVSGGRIRELFFKQIIHNINSDDMSISFQDGTQRTWKLAVQRVYSYDNGIVIKTTGNHTAGGISGISAWGFTRANRAFTTVIEEPMIIRGDCQYRLVSAKLVQLQSSVITITFGLNASGTPITCPEAGNSFYLRAMWSGSGNREHSILLPY